MNEKILLVDDDPTLIQFVAEFLSNDGMQIFQAANGQEALRLAYMEHPDLVVLDVMMPGMDGWEVTARLREMADIPIILITGKTSEADKLRGFKLGIDDYVTKPFSFAELSARIRAVLTRISRTPLDEQVVQFGKCKLDIPRRELKINGELVSLTPTEYRLLEVLAQNRGHAVSENELVQAIWGNNRQEDSSVVRRYIWLLRRKIEDDPSSPSWVITVRGFGYRLEL
ncbi:MAG: response regulator transcription factor [Anaerolineaceae bacterium]|nr:response regulator transcription factor [Anaerolineaceae bacterium]